MTMFDKYLISMQIFFGMSSVQHEFSSIITTSCLMNFFQAKKSTCFD